MSVTVSAPSDALASLREAKSVLSSIQSSTTLVPDLLDAIMAGINRCLEIYWSAAYAQDKQSLLDTISEALTDCAAVDENFGPDVSRVVTLLTDAQTSINSWVTETI